MGFLIGTLLMALNLGLFSLLICYCLSSAVYQLNISCLLSHSVLALVCLQHFCDYLYRDGWMESKDKYMC